MPGSTYVFLRHGLSVGNENGFHQGQFDFPLTDIGREQAHRLLHRWKQEEVMFDLIISSPLSRAKDTAEIIASGLDIPIEIDPVWMERDNGELHGISFEKGRQLFPRPSFYTPYQAFGRTGEGDWALFIRASQGIQNIMNRPPGRYLIVSHGGILNKAIHAILGITPHANGGGPRFVLDNTAFATFFYNPEYHECYVLGLNDNSHLSGLSAKGKK
jgi:2,3-bisphosphoglycerate-dependent phosphoglycerate mutase